MNSIRLKYNCLPKYPKYVLLCTKIEQRAEATNVKVSQMEEHEKVLSTHKFYQLDLWMMWSQVTLRVKVGKTFTNF